MKSTKTAADKGRHFAGSPTAKNIFAPGSRTGSPSGYFVGTGVNRKTAARPEHQGSRSSPSTNYTRQAQQFTRQAPEPFRNPAVGGNPLTRPVPRVPNREGTAAPGVTPRPARVASPYVNPMSQSAMNLATGHKANYRPHASYGPQTSGYPVQQGVRRAGNAASQAGNREATNGGRLMRGTPLNSGGRGLVQGPGVPARLMPTRAPKGQIPQG